jgi:hypothetical protein
MVLPVQETNSSRNGSANETWQQHGQHQFIHMTHFKLKLSVKALDIYMKERSITKLEDRRTSKVCKAT